MKKIVLLLVILLVSIFSGTYAQVGLGIKGGLNISSCRGCNENLGELSYRNGVAGGVFVNISVNSFFSVQPEILYSQQGFLVEGVDLAQFDFNQLGFSFGDFRVKNDYVNLPILLKFYPLSGLYFQASPQVGFLVSSRGEIIENGTSTEGDTSDSFNSLSFSTGFGIGYEHRYGFNVDFRYILGISNMFQDTETKNDVIQITIGYSIIKNRN